MQTTQPEVLDAAPLLWIALRLPLASPPPINAYGAIRAAGGSHIEQWGAWLTTQNTATGVSLLRQCTQPTFRRR
ncbi:MAG: hypothetical protein KF726_05215 [Anaerolineae bacterium]|nr:hypothetical protein [Anaerolineae bacterium]